MKKIIWLLIVIIGLGWFGNLNAQITDIDLIWETNTYVPLGYLGKPLPSPGSSVRVAALPSSPDFYFEWTKDGLNLSTYSGWGKNIINFYAGRADGGNNIGLTVRDREQRVITQTSLNIPVTNPQIIFYEEHPLTGIDFSHAITSSLNLIKQETTLVAEPLFFDNKYANQLIYNWTLAESKVPADTKGPKFMTLILPSESSKGTHDLVVEIKALNSTATQEAIIKLPIYFDTSANFNLSQ